jgi:glycosyltransferase involved in cell wall biosynthesis
MRLAQLAPVRVAVPPRDYGGTERCIATLTNSLVQLGQEVTLFASGDSQTAAHLVPLVPQALTFDPAIDAVAYQYAALAQVYRQADQFDIIHSHLEYHTLPFATMSRTPTVLTLHGRLDRPEFAQVYRQFPDAHYVAISHSQQATLPDLPWAGIVHHGIDVDDFPFVSEHGNYLAFVGRIAPEKGPDVAIAVAKRTGIPLKMAAKVDPVDRAYFEAVIQPLLDDPLIDFLGPVDERRKREVMSHALALILPIAWPEPFGMVFIEALACGTPVLTCPAGAAPEIVEDGVTGYLRQTGEELAEAALHIPNDILRTRCRLAVQRRFAAEQMARGYLAVYERIQHARGHGVFSSTDPLIPSRTHSSTIRADECRQPLMTVAPSRERIEDIPEPAIVAIAPVYEASDDPHHTEAAGIW